MLVEFAPAKVNLALRVLDRRRDGYHNIESLVAFASIGDELALKPGPNLALTVRGRFAKASGPMADNLVLRAVARLAARVPGLQSGGFTLTKNLPVAAGLGGGSSDAAAALRLLARANRISFRDQRLADAAREVGADVPVCLDPRARRMRGIGDRLSSPLKLAPLAAVLVNPSLVLSTAAVFARFDRVPPAPRRAVRPLPIGDGAKALRDHLATASNDLETTAISLRPQVATVLAALRAHPKCWLARMSGSGATCFGIFTSRQWATAAARQLAAQHRRWWVQAVVLR